MCQNTSKGAPENGRKEKERESGQICKKREGEERGTGSTGSTGEFHGPGSTGRYQLSLSLSLLLFRENRRTEEE